MGLGGRRPDNEHRTLPRPGPDSGQQLEEAATLPANVAEDVLSSQRTLRADEVRALEAASPLTPSSTPSVPLRSAIPPPPSSDPGAFAEPSPWRSSFASFSELRQGVVDRVTRFIAERPGLVIGGASAIAGTLLVGAVIVFVVASEPPVAPAAADNGASAGAPASASTTSATMPSASEVAAAPAPPAGAAPIDEGVTPRQLEVSANAPIARVRIGKRVVDMEVPAPNIAVDLTAEEKRRLSVSVTSTDGRIASGMWAPGDPALALEFGDAPAPRPAGKAGAKAGASKARTKAPRR